MTGQGDTKRKRKPRSLIGNAEMAEILVFAKLHGAARAAKEFSLAERTITRKRQLIAKGEAPELAELVQKAAEENNRKHGDKLDSAYETALSELESKLKGATVEELTEAVKVLADARLNRDVLLNEPLGYRASQGAATAGRQDARGAGASATVGRGAGATGSGAADPVH